MGEHETAWSGSAVRVTDLRKDCFFGYKQPEFHSSVIGGVPQAAATLVAYGNAAMAGLSIQRWATH